MKVTHLFALFVLFSQNSSAQDVTQPVKPKFYNKEIGVFGQLNIGSSNTDNNVSFGGVQFKKWKNDWQGFRVIAGYGNYSDRTNFYSNHHQEPSPDTSTTKYTSSDINMGIIGLGIEAKRTFYKRIVLFAALELRGGYGSGKQEDYIETSVNNASQSFYNRTRTASRDASLIYLAATPSIGAKVQFRRLNLGLEATAVNLNMTSIKVANKDRAGISNFDMGGSISNRVFLSYSF